MTTPGYDRATATLAQQDGCWDDESCDRPVRFGLAFVPRGKISRQIFVEPERVGGFDRALLLQ
jgi:hypothetical protein